MVTTKTYGLAKLLIGIPLVRIIWLFALAGCYYGGADSQRHRELSFREPFEAEKQTPAQLAQRIASIAPWSSYVAYSQADWDKILDVANELNQSNSDSVRAALSIFSGQAAQVDATHYLEISKAFILIRVMFRLPESEIRGNWARGGGWIADQSSKGPGWPVVWRRGRPKLASPFLAYDGIAYDPVSDYEQIRKTYRKRI
jgi:hypothetical protein